MLLVAVVKTRALVLFLVIALFMGMFVVTEYLRRDRVRRMVGMGQCPDCGKRLSHFSGLEEGKRVLAVCRVCGFRE